MLVKLGESSFSKDFICSKCLSVNTLKPLIMICSMICILGEHVGKIG